MFGIDGWQAAAVLVKIAVYSGSFLAAGGTIFALLFRAAAGQLNTHLKWLISTAAVFAIAASGLQFGVFAASLTGDVQGMMDPEMLAVLWDGPAGSAFIARSTGLFLLIVAAHWIWKLHAAVAVSGVLLTCLSFSLVGHAVVMQPELLQGLVMLHLLAVSYWLGALLPLRAAARGALSLSETADVAEKFGRLAVWIVAALVLAGVLIAWKLLGSPFAIFTNPYGQLLGIKVLIVGGLMALAALNKFRLVPAMRKGIDTAAPQLTRVISVELLLVHAIFVATAILTTMMHPPALMNG